MGINIPSGTPSAGDTFSWAGFQYVYMTNPDRWVTNGFVGAEDPFADYALATFTTTPDVLQSLDDAGDYKETDFWPFRAGSFTQGTPQSDAELTALWPDNATAGMWYVSDSTIIAVAGGNAFNALPTGWHSSNHNTQAGFDNDMVQITAGSGNSLSYPNGINPGSFTQAGNFGSLNGIGIVADDNNNQNPSIPATGRTWKEVTRLVILGTDSNGMIHSLEMFRGPNVLHSVTYEDTHGFEQNDGTAQYYDNYWRVVPGNLITEYNS